MKMIVLTEIDQEHWEMPQFLIGPTVIEKLVTARR
jgi:hypothetical protein